MEEHWIYVRTAAGEATIQRRKRLAHRDLRALLARVDGMMNVGALKRQIGDGDLVERSLTELERLRLVAKSWVPERAEETVDRYSTPTNPTVRRRTAPLGGAWLKRLRDRSAAWARGRQARRDERAFLRAYEVNTAEDNFAPVKLKPIRRGPKQRKNWLARGVVSLLLLAGCALLLIVSFPYGRYRQEVEQRLSSALGEPVTISEIGFSLQPYPNLTLGGVGIGIGCQVGAIRLVPAPLSLFGKDWVIEHAQFENLSLRRQGIASSARWFTAASGDRGSIALRRASIERMSLDLDGARLDGLSGEMQMSPAGRVVKILLHDEARGLRLEATPGNSGYSLILTGNSAKLPLAPDLVFETLEAHGDVSADGLRLDSFEAGLYGGSVSATATLDWSHGARLVAEAALRHTSLNRLAKAISSSFSIDGEISGKFHFDAHAVDLSRLGDGMHFEGAFAAGRGQLNRFDLMEALRATRPTRGGYTRFDGLTGALRRDELGLHLHNLRLDGGALQATGVVDIDRSEMLKGRLDLELRGPVVRARASAAVGGNLAEPQLLTGRSERR